MGYKELTLDDGTRAFEHRLVASKHLNRKLHSNEVVHHINGQPDDNSTGNLCVMDRTKHEHFHAWLTWVRRKKGSYPEIASQRLELVNHYGGIVLDDHKTLPRAANCRGIAAISKQRRWS